MRPGQRTGRGCAVSHENYRVESSCATNTALLCLSLATLHVDPWSTLVTVRIPKRVLGADKGGSPDPATGLRWHLHSLQLTKEWSALLRVASCRGTGNSSCQNDLFTISTRESLRARPPLGTCAYIISLWLCKRQMILILYSNLVFISFIRESIVWRVLSLICSIANV